MNRHQGRTLIAVLLMVGAACAVDTDNDGLADEVEQKLGSDPKVAETMTEIGDDGDDDAVGEAGQALDVAKICAAHVAGNRWLFKITFVGATDPAGKQISLYLDADNDQETGRRQDRRRGLAGGQGAAQRPDQTPRRRALSGRREPASRAERRPATTGRR